MGSEVEELEHQQASVRDASVAGGNFTHCATAPVPIFPFPEDTKGNGPLGVLGGI